MKSGSIGLMALVALAIMLGTGTSAHAAPRPRGISDDNCGSEGPIRGNHFHYAWSGSGRETPKIAEFAGAVRLLLFETGT